MSAMKLLQEKPAAGGAGVPLPYPVFMVPRMMLNVHLPLL
jgi:hypothetical protein